MNTEDFFYLSINNRSSSKYYPLNTSANFVSKTPETLVFDFETRWNVGVSNFSHGRIDTSRDIKYICIYLDFISNQMFGDELKKIVFMAPFSNKEGFRHQIFNVKYCKMEKTSLADVRCVLTDETGEEIQFIDDSLTCIELKFEKGI